MGYYMGDMRVGIIRRRGGAMRGDPGFFSFLKSAAGAVAGFIPGVGGAISHAIEKIGGPGARRVSEDIATKAIGIVKKHPVLTAAGGAAVGGIGGLGHHLLKHPAVQAAMGVRRHRRMRVTNPKALRRALRRAHGFAKLAMKTIHLVHPRKKVRFGGFRKKKAR